MKKITLLIGTCVLAVCLIILSCRKEISSFAEGAENVPSSVLESSKIFYEKSATITEAQIEAKQKKIFKRPVKFWRRKFIRLRPLWKQSRQITVNGHTKLLVPTIENRLATKKVSIRRFFVFDLKGERPTKGEIVEMVGLGYDITPKVDELLGSYEQESIPGFSGAIFRYDLNYLLKSSALYTSGIKSSKKIRYNRELASKTSSNGIKGSATSASVASSSDSGGGTGGSGTTSTTDGPCTLFYLYTYEMDSYGNITSESYSYLYSTGDCSGTTPGGNPNPGGGDPGSSDPNGTGNTGGTNTDYTPGGGGGGDYGGNTIASISLTANFKAGATLCGYYDTRKVGDGYTGGVSNLGFTVTIVYSYGDPIVIPVVIPDACFQIGSMAPNSAAASTLFVNAYNLAVDEVAFELQNNIISPTKINPAGLAAELSSWISMNLMVMPGSNSFIPGPCLGNLPVTAATFNCY